MSFPSEIRAVSVSLVLIISNCTLAHGQTQDAEKAASLYSAIVINADAWIRGDYLAKISREFESLDESEDGAPAGIVAEEIIYNRGCFDWENQRFAQYHLRKKEITNYNAGINSPVKTVSWGGATVDVKAKRAKRLNSDSTRRLSTYNDNLPQEFLRSRFFDFRGLPLLGTEVLGDSAEAYREEAAREGGRLGLIKMEEGDEDTIVLTYFVKNPKEVVNEKTGTTVYHQGQKILRTFNRKTLNLVASEIYFVTGQFLTKDKLFSKTTLEWEEHDGVYVPSSYVDVRNAVVLVGGRTEFGRKTTRVKFHWFSVNNVIDESLLDGSKVKNRGTIVDLTIPENVDAVSLIEESRERLKGERRSKTRLVK